MNAHVRARVSVCICVYMCTCARGKRPDICQTVPRSKVKRYKTEVWKCSTYLNVNLTLFDMWVYSFPPVGTVSFAGRVCVCVCV